MADTYEHQQGSSDGNLVTTTPGAPEAAPGAMALPSVITYASLYNTAQRVYSWRFDEALRHDRENALAMLCDCGLTGILQERQVAVAGLPWHITSDDPKNPKHKEAARILTAIVKGIPFFDTLRLTMTWARWYGRYGIQFAWNRAERAGFNVQTPTNWAPVNGDKIQYRYRRTPTDPVVDDNTPVILVNSAEIGRYWGATTVYTEQGPGLLLTPGFWRSRFVINHHLPEDADYYEAEQAGGIHGVGIRSKVYWNWWLTNEWLSNISDLIQKVGQGGFLLFWYEAGNKESEAQATEAANKASQNTVIVWPRPIGQEKPGAGVDVVTIPMGGTDVLLKLLDHEEKKLERFIVGQSMSSGADNESGLGGTGRANFAADTKYRIVKMDAAMDGEALTRDLVCPLVSMNMPWATGYGMRLEYQVDRPNSKDTLDAAGKVYSMGVALDADEVREVAGLSKPDENAEIVKKPEGQPGPAGDGGDGDPSGGGDELDLPEPGQGGGSGGDDWQPYTGARGGRWERNPTTGKVRHQQRRGEPTQYTRRHPPRMYARDDWREEKGPRGGTRWVHTATGKVSYRKPGEGANKKPAATAGGAGKPSVQAPAPGSKTAITTAEGQTARRAWTEGDQEALHAVISKVKDAAGKRGGRGTLGVTGLREIAKAMGVTGHGKLDKAGLVAAITGRVHAFAPKPKEETEAEAKAKDFASRIELAKHAEAHSTTSYVDRVVNSVLLSPENYENYRKAEKDVLPSEQKTFIKNWRRNILDQIKSGDPERPTPLIKAVLRDLADAGYGNLTYPELLDVLHTGKGTLADYTPPQPGAGAKPKAEPAAESATYKLKPAAHVPAKPKLFKDPPYLRRIKEPLEEREKHIADMESKTGYTYLARAVNGILNSTRRPPLKGEERYRELLNKANSGGRLTAEDQTQMRDFRASVLAGMVQQKEMSPVAVSYILEDLDKGGYGTLKYDEFVKKARGVNVFRERDAYQRRDDPTFYEASPAATNPGGGHWITLSEHDKAGQSHGTSHVFVGGDGKIEKGPAKMVGDKLSELPHKEPTKESEPAAAPVSAPPAVGSSPPEKPAAAKKPYKPNIEYEEESTPEDYESMVKSILGGKHVDSEGIAKFAGAPDGTNVELSLNFRRKSVNVSVFGKHFESNRSIAKDEEGRPYIENCYFQIDNEHAGKGLGVDMFSQQVADAAAAGFDHIKTNAARTEGTGKTKGMNGYYTWPRFGYDGPIPEKVKGTLPGNLQSDSLLDLMSKPGGPEWWSKNGTSVECTFDLKPGSRSRQVLAAYLTEKGKHDMAKQIHQFARDESPVRPAHEPSPSDQQSKYETPDTSPEDDAALDRVWAAIQKSGFKS